MSHKPLTWRDWAWSLVLAVPAATVVGGIAYLFRDALGPLITEWAAPAAVLLLMILILS